MAGIKTVRKLVTDNAELNKAQQYVKQSVDPISKSDIINGTLLKNVSLKTGKDNNIQHKLDREPLGWIIVRQRAQADIWDAQDENTLKKTTLRLLCSVDVKVDIWIF